MEEKKKNEIDNINDIYQAEKEMYESRLDEAKKLYDEKTKEAKLQAEAEKLIIDKNQKEIVELINSYAPQWFDAGKTLGEKLCEGVAPAIDEIQKMLDSIWASINAAKAAASSISVPSSRSISNVTNNNNNSKTNTFNVYNNSSNSSASNDIESTMRKMAFSIL